MRGRYPLESTLWLARQLREGKEPPTLRRQWLVMRYRCQGKPVADGRSSFRKAVVKARELNRGKP